MTKKQELEARQRILNAAEVLFAEKGFDGARVEEIAHNAGVNKALIYYYFESKEKILDELLGGFQKLISELTSKTDGNLEMDRATTDQLLDFMLTNLESHQNLLKILLSEILKGSSWGEIVFNFLDRILKTAATEMKRLGSPVKDENTIRVAEFFTAVVPIVFYTIIADKWSRRFKMDRNTLKQQFKKALRASHIDYWKRLEE